MMQLHKDSEVFQELIVAAANKFNFEPFQVEKDYFVSFFLKNLREVAPNIVFKGGTSLSKCYNIIDRFSEDIDLTIYFEEEKLTHGQLKTKQKSLISSIKNTIEKLGFVLKNNEEIHSGKNFNRFRVEYESIYEHRGQMLDHILIETTLTYRPYPCETKLVNNYITKYLEQEGYEDYIELIKIYELEPFEMKIQTVERTFIDKIFAICDYYLSGKFVGKSRHIYDIHMIYKSGFLNENILNELVPEIVETRRNGPDTYSCQVGSKPIEIIKEIIENEVFKNDYETITREFLSQYVDYHEAIDTFSKILTKGWIPEVILDSSESIIK